MNERSNLTAKRANLTPAQRALLKQRLAGKGLKAQVTKKPLIDKRAASETAPLSYSQQRQYFLWQLNPDSAAYHLSGSLYLQGQLDIEAVQSAFERLVKRHPSLRTQFQLNAEEQVEQRILADLSLPVQFDDLCGESTTAQTSRVDAFTCRPFDLHRAPLLRVAVFRLAADKYRLALTLHHIVADGWSMRILIAEFVECYRATRLGRSANLAPLNIDYGDYAIWHNQWYQDGKAQKHLDYWTEQLAGEQPVLNLTTDFPRQHGKVYQCGRYRYFMSPEEVAPLRALAMSKGCTLFMLLLAAFEVLLFRYTSQRDIRIGVPIANRHREETTPVVGCFINTQVLRGQLDNLMSFAQVLEQAKTAALDAQMHQDLPFEQLVDALHVDRSLDATPLFQVMFNHLRNDHRVFEHLPELNFDKFDADDHEAQFDLTLRTVELEDGTVVVAFLYAEELFEAQTIERIGEHYRHILKTFAQNPEQTLGGMTLLNDSEQQQLAAWGVNQTRYADVPLVHQQVARWVDETPDAEALVMGQQSLSYGELDRQANRLANCLINEGVGPEFKVGLALERSIEMVVALLAVLKAGGAYVPLDPGYPDDRLDYMISDSELKLILTQNRLQAPLQQRLTELEAVKLLAVDDSALIEQPETIPQVQIHRDNLAYVIYTSGSTGRPKGVAVSHGPLAMHVRSIGERYDMVQQDRELQFASINFDGAHERTWVPLAFGATLMPRDNEMWSVERTAQEIETHGITIACFTPSYLQQMADILGEDGSRLPIRSYTVGGEATSRASFNQIQQVLKPQRIINGYGPTETVVTPTIAKAHMGEAFETAYMPIGTPVGDRQSYVLDDALNQVPAGVTGELYIGGGLARGYWQKPGLTAERFIANPFADDGSRLYRTGDLVRWLSNGELDYLGRVDHQVKVRGFRIELGEIESRLLAETGVSEAVVIAEEGQSGARLIAYVSPLEDVELDGNALKQTLASTMPDYMVPSVVAVLPRLPLTPAGKVDRHALPKVSVQLVREFEAPKGEVEQALAAIWNQVLDVSALNEGKGAGRQDNFFELGGDSILSLQIIARLRQQGWDLTPKQVFEQQQLQALAAVAVAIQQPAAMRLEQWLDQYPVANAQEFEYWKQLTKSANPTITGHTGERGRLTLQPIELQTHEPDFNRAYRTETGELILTAAARSLCRLQNCDSLLMQVSLPVRQGNSDDTPLIGGTPGLRYPVSLTANATLNDTVIAVKEAVRLTPNQGVGFAQFINRGTPEQRQLLREASDGMLAFSFLGEDEMPVDDIEVTETAALHITAKQQNQQLVVELDYQPSLFENHDIRAWAAQLAEQIEQLLAHCRTAKPWATPTDFPLADLDTQDIKQLPELGVSMAALQDIYPLSPMQEGMLFHSVAEPGDDAYINQLRVDIDNLDVSRFTEAWRTVFERYDVLRSGFLEQTGLPLQWVADSASPQGVLPLELAQQTDAQKLDELADGERAKGFELSRPPLMRLLLVPYEKRYHLIWTMHHLLLDGWSSSHLMGEVLRFYHDEMPTQKNHKYRDYIAWLQRQDSSGSETYWRGELERMTNGPTHLSACLKDTNQTDKQSGSAKVIQTFDTQATTALDSFARSQKVTVNTLLQAAWSLILGRYTSQNTVTFGVTVSGRPSELEGIEQQVGLFINTLPLIVDLNPAQSLPQWLQSLQQQNLSHREYEYTPLYNIQRWSGVGREGLFDTLFIFENYPLDQLLQDQQTQPQDSDGELTIVNVEESQGQTNYPLTIAVLPGEELTLQLSYAREHFGAADIERLALQLRRLVSELVQTQSDSLGEVQVLGDIERQQLAAWGVNQTRYADVPLVHQQVAHWVEETPDAEALVMGQRSLSYGELDREANRLANCLINEGVGPECKVGLALERSIEMVVALLAVLKAGGAYVPLDPGYPDDRLDYMISDSELKLILTQSRLQVPLQQRLKELADVKLLAVDDPALIDQPESTPQVAVHRDNLAYVIYTSGSTGRPKGVAVSHGPLAMHVRSIGERYDMVQQDRELQFASINFDGAHERTWVPLAFGATLMPRDNEMWSVERTAQEIETHGITIACFTPSYLQQMADILGEAGSRLPIRSYTVGGEATSRASFNQIQQVLKPQRIINGYGPTETVVTPTIAKAHMGEAFDTAYMPIGTPVGDRQTYVLDGALNQVPAGVTGELYIGGGLARGYWQRPGLTAERFIANPFADDGSRLYRTGDLVRWLNNGELEYLGRVDHQVKVRGFRIELGEIESCLLAETGVSEAVVIAEQGQTGARLIAYVSPVESIELDGNTLMQTLATLMPDYMVPSVVAVLPQLPLTPAGKVDRQALPKVGLQMVRAFEAPKGEVEQALAEIWNQVLNVSTLNEGKGAGRQDSFFELGGDSILSLQIIARMRQQGWRLTPKQVFEHQQLQALAAQATPVVAEQATAKATGEVPLLPIQADFFAQPVGSKDHWNQAVLLTSEQALNPQLLEQALQALIDHHDGFRLRYAQTQDNSWRQYYGESHNTEALLWQNEQVQGQQRNDLFDRVQQSLDIGKGQLLRALLLKAEDGSSELLVAVHHLVVDGMSWRILLEDLETAYRQLDEGNKVILPVTTSSYQAWAEQLAQYPAANAEQLAYWQSVAEVVTDIPADNPEAVGTFAEPAFAELRLDKQSTRQLLQQAPAAYDTQVNDLLLTALSRSLCQFSGNDQVLIDMEGHGREDLNDNIDLSRTLGWFTSLYPVRLAPTADIGESIVGVKQTIRDVPHHGLGYGVLKYMGDEHQRKTLSAGARAPVLFNYLGQFDNLFEQNAGQEQSLWQASQEYTGQPIDPQTPMPYSLNVNGLVYQGELQLTVTYSPARYKQATVERWVAMFKDELQALIEHCCGVGL